MPTVAETDKLRGSVATPAVTPDPAADAAPAAKPTTIVETGHAATQGPISIFVSRKEKKIYVRQNFSPLFYAPVTIDHPEQALGTHVFTAMSYLDDGSTLRWNVVSMPAEPPKAKREADNDRRGHGAAAARSPSRGRSASCRRRKRPRKRSPASTFPRTPSTGFPR